MRELRRLTLALLLGLALLLVPAGTAAHPTDSTALRAAADAATVIDDLEALQAIADANGDTRASGTPGYEASVEYVVDQLDAAGYDPVVQEFEFPFFQRLSPGELERLEPTAKTYAPEVDFFTMDFSGSGEVTAPLQAVNDIVIPPGAEASTSDAGCEPEDFTGFETGNIALVQRGTCNFIVKVENAVEAGASAVILFNEGQEGRQEAFIGTLGEPVDVPVVMTSFAVGAELYALLQSGEDVVMRVETNTLADVRTTWNVIAELEGARADRTVVVGAHLDSVLEGPGINDNGSGSGLVLELAREMADLGIEPKNTVRFIWFGAEESGLLGSEHYVSELSKAELKDIAVMLNFDMVASTNFVRFVYDGDGSATGARGPAGSGNVEDVFLDYFGGLGLPVEATAFDGRSDYGPFIENGVPAGGLFTGAEGIKTAAQQTVYGGVVGEQYDPCYHEACDTIDNVDAAVLEQMLDAAAHATLTFAMTQSAVAGTAQASEKAQANGLFSGPHAQR